MKKKKRTEDELLQHREDLKQMIEDEKYINLVDNVLFTEKELHLINQVMKVHRKGGISFTKDYIEKEVYSTMDSIIEKTKGIE